MEIVLRAAAIYVFLWIVTRAMGKREFAQITIFELILLITIGDLIQQAVTQDDRSVVGGFLAVSTLAVLIVLVSAITAKFERARDAIEGKPIIVVSDGKPLEEAMRSERLTVDDVRTAARDQGIGDLRKVRVGILEADGKFSFILDEPPAPGQQRSDQQHDVS